MVTERGAARTPPTESRLQGRHTCNQSPCDHLAAAAAATGPLPVSFSYAGERTVGGVHRDGIAVIVTVGTAGEAMSPAWSCETVTVRLDHDGPVRFTPAAPR